MEIRKSILFKSLSVFLIFLISTNQVLAFAINFEVNNLSDDLDAANGDFICDTDLGTPGSQCSLRAALTEANAYGQTFPGQVPGIFASAGGTVTLTGGLLPTISYTMDVGGSDLVEVDANDSYAYIFNVQANDVNIHDFAGLRGAVSDAIYVGQLGGADGTIIEGNVIGCTEELCEDGNHRGIVVGWGATDTTISDNTISGNDDNGINLSATSGVVIMNNRIGTDESGTLDRGNGLDGIEVNDSDSITISGNVISGNNAMGLELNYGAENVDIYGNKIGVDTSGSLPLGNGGHGIYVVSPDIGQTLEIGNSEELPNIIADNGSAPSYHGIEVDDGGNGTVVIQNNYIGTGINGSEELPNAGYGVFGTGAIAFGLVIGGDGVENGAELDLLDNDGDGEVDEVDENEGNVIVGGGSTDYALIQVGADLDTLRVAENNLGVLSDGVTVSGGREGLYVGNEGSIANAVYIVRNLFGGSYRSAVDLHVGEGEAIDFPVIIQGNYAGIARDGETELGGGGFEIEAGNVTFGGVNNLAATDGEDIGDGNVVSYTQSEDSPPFGLTGTYGTEVYVYGNIFGLARDPLTGEYNVNAPNRDANIALSGINLHTVEVGAVDMGGVNSPWVNGDDFTESSQLRNVISGNYPEEAEFFKLSLGVFGMCDSTALFGEEGYCDNDDNQGHVTIVNNYFGLDFSGNEVDDGVDVFDAGFGLVIAGGDEVNIGWDGESESFDEEARNVVGGYKYGIMVVAANEVPFDGVVRILGNYVGVNAAGDTAVPNGGGVKVSQGTVYVGYTGPSGEGDNPIVPVYGTNVISGNNYYGVGVEAWTDDDLVDYDELRVVGNYIGTDATGEMGIPNGAALMESGGDIGGISIGDIINDSVNIVIGGPTVDDRNVISGNYGAGIAVVGVGPGLQIIGNYIGLSADGQSAVPNISYDLDDISEFEAMWGPIDRRGMGEGIALVDWGVDMGGGVIQVLISGVEITDNYISGNELDGIAIVHVPNTGEVVGAGTVVGGLGQWWDEASISGNYFGVAGDGTTSMLNGGYAIYRDDGVGGAGGIFTEDPYISDNYVDGGYYFANLPDVDPAMIEGIADLIYANNTWGDLVVGLYHIMAYETEGDPAVIVPDYFRPDEGGDDDYDEGGGGGRSQEDPDEDPEEDPEVIPEVVVEEEIDEDEEVTKIEENNDYVGGDEDVSNETEAEVEEEEEEIVSPTTLDEVDVDILFENETYHREVLSLLVDTCSSETVLDCLKQVYDLTEPTVTEEELGDAVVFGKQPGEEVTVPRIVNLKGTVGTSPAILALSQANDNLTIEISEVQAEDTEKKGSSPVYIVTGTTDAEGKAVLNYTLPAAGNYTANIYARRGDSKVEGKSTQFVVDPQVDQEFFVTDVTVTEEDEYERITKVLGVAVEQVLAIDEKVDPRFNAKEFVEFRRTGGKVYVAH